MALIFAPFLGDYLVLRKHQSSSSGYLHQVNHQAQKTPNTIGTHIIAQPSRSRRPNPDMQPQRCTGLVFDAEHRNIAQSHLQITSTYRATSTVILQFLACLSTPILGNPARATADPHPIDSDSKCGEPEVLSPNVLVVLTGFVQSKVTSIRD